MWWCEWLDDISLPANISLSPSINRPWATAESTSLREKGSERNETQQGAGPCHCCVIVTWCDSSHPRDTAVWPSPRAHGKAEQGIKPPGWSDLSRTCRIRAAARLAQQHQDNTRALPWGMDFGHTSWETSTGTCVTAHKPVKSVLRCVTSESFGHHETAT